MTDCDLCRPCDICGRDLCEIHGDTEPAARWCRANEPENDGDSGMNPLRMTRCLWQVLRLTIAPDSTARRWAR